MVTTGTTDREYERRSEGSLGRVDGASVIGNMPRKGWVDSYRLNPRKEKQIGEMLHEKVKARGTKKLKDS